ncbi:MAG: NAD-dependent epimerase/dehydratase family protein [Acidobacteria bacterium]|nr:NAD-dependent epimerase/dehydratase family protein [Acidobacteriota bacterium]
MTALVTGANGFIGCFLVQELLSRGHQVRCFVLNDEPLQWLNGLDVEIVYGDICRIDTLSGAVEGVDYVYHLAGVKTVWDEATYFRVNFQGTKNILDATWRKNRDLKRFIYVSSQAAAGPSFDGHPLTEDDPCHPLTAYGKSKRAAEEYLQARSHEVPVTILRPSLVYGPRNVETELLYDITRWRLMPYIRHHDQYLNLIHIRDAVEGILLAAEHERARGQIYFITGQERYTWQEIAERSFRLGNNKGWVIPIPWAGVKLAAGVVKSYRKLMGQPFSLIDDKMNEMRQRYWVCSGQKAKRELGFEPKISLGEGIEETLYWFEETRR